MAELSGMNLQTGFNFMPASRQNLKTIALKQLANVQTRELQTQKIHAKYCINIQLINFAIRSALYTSPYQNIEKPSAQLGQLDHVWRACELGTAGVQTVKTGYKALDNVLPGKGWPCGAMTDVLQAQPGLHEWGLVAPSLAALQLASPSAWVALVGAPHCPFGPALGARQLNMQRLININAATKNNDPGKGPSNGPALLWATQEALQCADVAAVLAWLPDARSAHLRRLQIAALTHHKLLFVFRPLHAQHESSPAPLRLTVAGAAGVTAGSDTPFNLQIHVFKRRGPLLALPVMIDTRPPRLAALLAASRERIHPHVLLPVSRPEQVDMSVILRKPLHALDRTASLQS